MFEEGFVWPSSAGESYVKDSSLSSRNRRISPRHPVGKPVVVRSPMNDSAETSGMTVNVGSGGALLVLEERIAPGMPVAVRFDMPTQAGGGHYSVSCTGLVLRVYPCQECYSTAVAFEKVEIMESPRPS